MPMRPPSKDLPELLLSTLVYLIKRLIQKMRSKPL